MNIYIKHIATSIFAMGMFAGLSGCASKAPINNVLSEQQELALGVYKETLKIQEHSHLNKTEAQKGNNYRCNDTKPKKSLDFPPIELMLYDADLREALNELSMLTGLSIISDFTVEGYVSTNITDATLEEALDMLLSAGNYGYKIFDNHVLVGSQNAGDPSFHLLSKTCYYTPVYLSPEQVRDLLPPYYQQFVNLNSPATSLSIVATDRIQQRLKKDILLLDTRPQQVQLELTIVEVSKSAMTALGLNWQQAKNYFANYQDPRSSSAFYAGESSYVLPRGAQRAFLNAIQAFANTGQASVKAMPSIVTLDGRTAKFQSMKTQWVNEEDGIRSANNRSLEISYGVQMSVIPKVADAHAIQLEIVSASVSDLITDHLGKKILINHSIASSIRVANGHTLVVGGLINVKEQTLSDGVMGVKNIPILGGLFDSEVEKKEQTEVLIVIKPSLIDS